MGIPTTPRPGPRWVRSYDFLEATIEPSWQPRRPLLHLLLGCGGATVTDGRDVWRECSCGRAHDRRPAGRPS